MPHLFQGKALADPLECLVRNQERVRRHYAAHLERDVTGKICQVAVEFPTEVSGYKPEEFWIIG